ncbi:exported hypothetical protein [Nitrospina gracilis 3/211]|uniref:Uncharacterized protein n=1 Tax=Nitrospina gracilis (strain 3/211) TaxID=1266370 RepID=M1Z032_NITG3|nr:MULTISPECIES: hypothetical protein [Nitrospina]MCF8723965.1 hypothetical protein [Nitrospina sp. Nb-3]CCQ91089.1 exported hypothetical protein [Nitrospina gracilis 3/211]
MFKRHTLHGIAFLAILFMASGCSVIMALSGDPEPNFAVIQPGASRSMVEKELGTPFHTDQQSGQRTDWYRYELGNAPNGDRALANFALDVYSILLWEIIATPRELMMGDDHEMSVVYGPGDRVIAVHREDEETVAEPIHLGNTPLPGKEKSTGTQPIETPGNQPVPGGRPPSSR